MLKSKIIKLFEKNWDAEPSSIIKYDNKYWVFTGFQSSVLVCYEIFDDEPVESGFTTINTELGGKILSDGEEI